MWKRRGNVLLLNVNPSEKFPTFMLWDESHGRFFKTLQAFSSLGEKPCHLWRGRGTQTLFNTNGGAS